MPMTTAARRAHHSSDDTMPTPAATDVDPLLDETVEEEAEHSGTNWSNRLEQWQRIAYVCAHILAAALVIVVIVWIHALGGLSWDTKHVFNWHPLLMVTAFAFMTVASLSFRTARSIARKIQKWMHGVAWAVAALCGMVALIAVFKSHNDALIANLYSLHSWIGCAVIGLYILQFMVGVVSFAWPLSSMTPLLKARILSIHRLVGPLIYNCMSITILLGIQEKEGFVGCAYTVDKPDTFPFHFFEIPWACRVSHTLGILTLVIALCTNLAWHDFSSNNESTSSMHSV